MITVKVRDKRCHSGFRIRFFDADVVTPEIYNFVKSKKTVCLISGYDFRYTQREDFLKDYVHLADVSKFYD